MNESPCNFEIRHPHDSGRIAGPLQSPAVIPGDIAEWEYDPARAQVCGRTSDGQVFFISKLRAWGGFRAFYLAVGDTADRMWLFPEHDCMVVAGRAASMPEKVLIYLWRPSHPGHHVRLVSQGDCPSLDALQVHLSLDGAVLLIDPDGHTELFNVANGVRILVSGLGNLANVKDGVLPSL